MSSNRAYVLVGPPWREIPLEELKVEDVLGETPAEPLPKAEVVDDPGCPVEIPGEAKEEW